MDARNPKTPGVYLEEISLLPISVTGVATSVPVFIGNTKNGTSSKPVKIKSLQEYELLFGSAAQEFNVKTEGESIKIELINNVDCPMYYNMQMFFDNGGEVCYIAPIVSETTDDIKKALMLLETEDEPTLIVLVTRDDVYLKSCAAILAHCAKMNRFAILGVPYDSSKSMDENILTFRNNCGTENLKYGASYYPLIETTLNYKYFDKNVNVVTNYTVNFQDAFTVNYYGSNPTPMPSLEVQISGTTYNFSIDNNKLTMTIPTVNTVSKIKEEWNKITAHKNFDIIPITGDKQVRAGATNLTSLTLENLRQTNTSLYNKIKTVINNQTVTLSPCSSVAGLYSYVDKNRGVWKAPANVSIASVVGPVQKISDDDQESLNVDSTSGKSINAIRAFSGKGTLVWGARTLAGNDNEWRYVPVRRLFNYLEESIKKASAFVVFEPNTPMTWLKVKTMIESFLDNLWRQGGLVGGTAEQAFFVNVGLGTTMTSQDILEGRMIIKVGVAAVRPAEFIILQFSHKLQEA